MVYYRYGANLYDIYLNNKKLHKKIIRKQRQKQNNGNNSESTNANHSIDNENEDETTISMDDNNEDDELTKIMNESKIDTINSILVCTGVYRGGNINVNSNSNESIALNNNSVNSRRHLNYGHKDLVINDPTLKQPRHICTDVYEAVNLVLNLEKILH